MTATEVYGREWVTLLTAAEAAAADREARDRYGIPDRVLMESAGRAAAEVIMRLHPRGRVAVVVGPGHNGGDGLVAARTLACWGRDVTCLAVGSRAPDLLLLHGHELPLQAEGLAAEIFSSADVLVDAILGTGTSGAPRPAAAAAIESINRSNRPVLSLDLPSGIDPDTGAVPGVAVNATSTVTFGWPKRGLLLQPARARCGRILAVEIGFPPSQEQTAGAALITPGWAATRLPRRPPDAHKGNAGRLLIVAGSSGMAGAATLAGAAASRSGAGLVRLASVAANREILQMLVPEAIFVNRDDPAALEPASRDVAAIVIGPGLGQSEASRASLESLLEVSGAVPLLLDADGLNLLAPVDERLERLAASRPLVLTPHPGELSRLTGESIAEIRRAPLDAAAGLADRLGCAVLLKGAPSVVAAAGRPVLVNTAGSSDVAKAGMGDHLSGVIGALLAGGLEAREAAAVGLFYSSRAAELAGRGRSLAPQDVTAALERAFVAPGPAEPPLGLPFVTFDQPARR